MNMTPIQKIFVFVKDDKGTPLANALVFVNDTQEGRTDDRGILIFDHNPSKDLPTLKAQAFGIDSTPIHIDITKDAQDITVQFTTNAACNATNENGVTPLAACMQGDVIRMQGVPPEPSGSKSFKFEWKASGGEILYLGTEQDVVFWDTDNIHGFHTVTVTITDVATGTSISPSAKIKIRDPRKLKSDTDSLSISMDRAAPVPTKDQFLWQAIRNRTKAIRFENYRSFIDKALCQDVNVKKAGVSTASMERQMAELYSPVHGVGAYELLKTATQIFLLLECGAHPESMAEVSPYNNKNTLFDPDEEALRLGKPISFDDMKSGLGKYLGSGNLPYIERVIEQAFTGYAPADSVFCNGYLSDRAGCPVLLELIWSYWHEEAMLVQSMNAISLRFQNRLSGAGRDPLAHLEIAPLYPINNLIFGYIQDELFRTSIKRRAYEYNHHYGISPIGKAVGTLQPADSRSQFLEAFHNLLYRATLFYKQADDTTMIADAFPVLNALREVHLLLAQGAHNQYGDLPWMARAEMLIQQWILARPEMREFLQTRAMVPYKEAWMPPLDAMKTMQGWIDVSVTHFHDLAEYGEQVLLSIRLGDWVDINNPLSAANWATYWRPEIQGYLHAYRVATGMDLTLEPREGEQAKLRAVQPAILLQQRLRSPAAAPMLTGKTPASKTFRERRVERRQ